MRPTLHFIAGKAGAGKTTLARRLGATTRALVICEDEWLQQLADPVENLSQYLAKAGKIRCIVTPLTIELLTLGTFVVFDFAGNSVSDRAWVRSIADRAGTDCVLHYLPVDDATCRSRVMQRNVTRPAGVFFGIVTEQQVDEVNRFFLPPEDHEGFTIVVHNATDVDSPGRREEGART